VHQCRADGDGGEDRREDSGRRNCHFVVLEVNRRAKKRFGRRIQRQETGAGSLAVVLVLISRFTVSR